MRQRTLIGFDSAVSLLVVVLLALAACQPPVPVVTEFEAPTALPAPTDEAERINEEVLDELLGEEIVDILPTPTDLPADAGVVSVRDLPIGQPGEYVNVTFGYRIRYPRDWYTRFGNRPVVASFSNLNPGVYNRVSMRGENCLVEINAGVNVYGLSLQDLATQLPKAFENAQPLSLDGVPALRVWRGNEGNTFESEWVYVEHEGRLFGISFEYAQEASEACLPGWETMLSNWEWFEPDFVVYRNPTYGYAISHPRRWFRFNGQEDGITLSSLDPAQTGDMPQLAAQGIVVHTTIFENPQGLTLKEWVIQNEGDFDLSNVNIDRQGQPVNGDQVTT